MQVLAKWTNEYGSLFKWSLINQDILVITDPEEVYKLCSREVNLPKPRALYKGLNTREPHNNMLATPDNEEWKYMRKIINPAFSPENIRKVGTQAEYAFAMHVQGLVSNLSARVTAEQKRMVLLHVRTHAKLEDLQQLPAKSNRMTWLWPSQTPSRPWHPRAKRLKRNQPTVWKEVVQIIELALLLLLLLMQNGSNAWLPT
ncbi:hypothetical protein WJX77_006294 [Trebouxia sp. C0004]